MRKRLEDCFPRFRDKKARDLMAMSLAMDPKLRKELFAYIRMGVRDIRPDYMYVLNRETGKHEYMDDPGAWNATLDLPSGSSMLVVLVRHRDGEWSIHGT